MLSHCLAYLGSSTLLVCLFLKHNTIKMENSTEENGNSTFARHQTHLNVLKNYSVLLRHDYARDAGNGKEQNGAWE